MPRIRWGRVSLAILLLIGFYIAWQRLKEQNVPLGDVTSTGLLFVVGLGGFFLLLIGMGKLLGKLFGGK